MSHIKKSKDELIKELENGYKEMSDINLELAQLSIAADSECLLQCEEKLTECE